MSEPTPPKSNKLLETIIRGIVAGKLGTMHHDHAARTKATSNFMEELEDEFAPMIGPMVEKVKAAIPEDHPLHALLGEMEAPTHQLAFLLQIVFIVPAVFGAISESTRIFAQPIINDLWSREPNIPLSPPDLADMVERTIMDEATAKGIARQSGIDGWEFDQLVLNTGEPYGPMDALRLWRQGRIDEAQLEHVIHYSRIRNEFIPNMKLLAHDFMSPADAVELTLKKVLGHDEGKIAFEKGGGYGPEFDDLLEGSGNPIGPEMAVNLWNHDLITEAEVERVIAHGRTNPSFTEDVKLTRHKFLSVFQIHQALMAGAVTPELAIEWMLADGFNHEQASAFAHAGKKAKDAGPKHPTETMIVQLYEAKHLSIEQTTTALKNMGYSDAEIPELLALSDARRSLALQNTAIHRVHNAFLAKRINAATVRDDLTKLEIPSAAVDHYLTTWEIEKSTRLKELTTAQVGQMFKKGFMSDAEAIDRWKAQGYDDEDSGLLLAEYGGPPPPGSPADIYIQTHPQSGTP